MIEAYRGQKLVVRCNDPSMIVQRLATRDLKRVESLQLPVTGDDIDSLIHWEHAVPLDLLVRNPEADLPLLYRYSTMPARRPVRVTVPVAPGFGKVVKLALSLDFAVKLEPSQPKQALVEELLHVADLYLHQTTVFSAGRIHPQHVPRFLSTPFRIALDRAGRRPLPCALHH